MARRTHPALLDVVPHCGDLATALGAPTRDELLHRLRSLPADKDAQLPAELAALLDTEEGADDAAIGAFYTPPPVVALACREALVAYLDERVAGLGTDAARALVERHRADDISPAQANAALTALRDVTVLDPACG